LNFGKSGFEATKLITGFLELGIEQSAAGSRHTRGRLHQAFALGGESGDLGWERGSFSFERSAFSVEAQLHGARDHAGQVGVGECFADALDHEPLDGRSGQGAESQARVPFLSRVAQR